jgi:hypothetical protein
MRLQLNFDGMTIGVCWKAADKWRDISESVIRDEG